MSVSYILIGCTGHRKAYADAVLELNTKARATVRDTNARSDLVLTFKEELELLGTMMMTFILVGFTFWLRLRTGFSLSYNNKYLFLVVHALFHMMVFF